MSHIITTNLQTKTVSCECGGKWHMVGNWIRNVLGHIG